MVNPKQINCKRASVPGFERGLAQATHRFGFADLMKHACIYEEDMSKLDMVKMLLVVFALALTGCDTSKEDNRRTPMGTQNFEEDIIKTSRGELTITLVGHGTLMFRFGEKVIHVDPVSREADYSKMPQGDVILITHEHRDHLDPEAIAMVRKEGTSILLPEKCASTATGGIVMRNGDVRTIAGFECEAVPAYNIVHNRPSGEPFHPRGEGNGYIITFGDKRVYIAGDTENVPEIKRLKGIDIAFLPMNLPYTMTPEMVADAAKAFRPKILYTYHFGSTDTSELVKLLAEEKEIEVRIREME